MATRRLTALLAGTFLAACSAAACTDSSGGGDPSATPAETPDPSPTPMASETPAAIEDDFCHGLRDGTLCDDGNACTTGDRCGLGVCRGRPASDGGACDDGDACTTGDACSAGVCAGDAVDCSELDSVCASGACDPATGECVARPGPDGVVCEDGDPCTLADACADGACVGRPKSCDDGDPCTSDTCVDGECRTGDACADLNGPCAVGACDPRGGGCIAVPLTDGVLCDDADPCTEATRCAAGVCAGGTQAGEGATCDDGDLCTTGDTCSAAGCVGAAVSCGHLDDACNVGVCAADTGECAAQPVADGTACDDGDACTSETTCQSGRCGAGVSTCFCAGKEAGTPCDDEDPCTVGDACADEVCVPGAARDCSAIDGACVAGVCDPNNGECVTVARAGGTSCDDGSPCTVNDLCVAGTCTGIQLDCSGLDGPCQTGRCEEGTGACVATMVPDTTPCNDGDACTGGDACTEGECVGPTSLCAACEGQENGTACDDGDRCTTGETCSGGACVGAAVSCSSLDLACEVGVCDPESGACERVPRTGGAACDDGNACTESDACSDGACVGRAIDLCGAAVDACDSPRGGDASSALVLGVADGSARAFGRIAPAGVADWFSLELAVGQRLTVRTASHCGRVFDTIIELTPGGAAAPAAINDDARDSVFSEIADFEVTQAGTWYVAVRGYEPTAEGTYLVEAEVVTPVRCESNEDCACAQERCELEGENAGACVPRMEAEVEPDDVPQEAVRLGAGAERLGEIHYDGDDDWYLVPLTAGRLATVESRRYCGEATPARITLFDLDGFTPLRETEGPGEGNANARISGFVPALSGEYLVLVESSATRGRYTLASFDEACTESEQCGCADMRCATDGEEAGTCLPRTTAAETGAAVPLALDTRLRGALDVPFDVDRYTLTLEPGTYDFEVSTFCGALLDTTLALLDAEGEVIAVDDDSGGAGGFSRIAGHVVETAGTWHLDVAGYRPVTGVYIIEARRRAAQ